MEKVVIIGNPNTGKTTLFNTLTKSNDKVANYSGVTVSAREKCINYSKNELKIIDLPGLYSINAKGADERVSLKFLNENKDSKIVYVATTTDLAKNLHLFTDLINKGFSISLFINENGAKLSNKNVTEIQDKLKVPIYYGDARKRRKDILSWIIGSVLNTTQIGELGLKYDEIVSLFNLQQLDMQKLDKFFLHPICGKLSFIVVLFIIYYISFVSIGERLSEYVFTLWTKLGGVCVKSLGRWEVYWIIDFFQTVIIQGLGSVIAFLPELFMILFCMYILEESGYLPRIAYLFNINLNKIGLNGKSIFGMAVGVGCTTSGYLATRNIDDNVCRQKTSMILPFIGCSAKIPIIIFLASNLIDNSGLIVGLVFILVILSAIAYLKFSTKNEKIPFIMELPRLKLPSFKRLMVESISIIKDFLKKVIFTILLVTTIVWGCTIVELKIRGETTTLLNIILSYIGIIFKPIGLDSEPLVMSLLSGLVAKENILSTLSMFGGVSELSTTSLISFILFIMLYSPCIPALRCAKSEFGKVFMWRTFLSQTIIAYGVSFVCYTFSSIGGLWLGFVMCIMFVVLAIKTSSIILGEYNFQCKNCTVRHKT